MGAATTTAFAALLCLLAAWGVQAADYDPDALAAALATATAARADAEKKRADHDAAAPPAPKKTREKMVAAETAVSILEILLDFLEAHPDERGPDVIIRNKGAWRLRQHAIYVLLDEERNKDNKWKEWDDKGEELATIERFATIDECVAKSTALLIEGQEITRKLEEITMELEEITRKLDIERDFADQQGVADQQDPVETRRDLETRRDSLAQTRRDLETRRDSLETQMDEIAEKQYNLNLAQHTCESETWLESLRPDYPKDYPEEHWPYCGHAVRDEYDYNEYVRYVHERATQEQEDAYEKIQWRQREEYNRMGDHELRLNYYRQHRQRLWQEYWRKLGKQHRQQHQMKVTSSEKNSKSDIIAAATIGASVLLLSSLAIITFRRLLQRQSKIHRRKWW